MIRDRPENSPHKKLKSLIVLHVPLQKNMKPAIRHGPNFQAVIPPLSEVELKPAKEPSAKKGGHGGSLISADAVLISVIGPEKAASDALPMDAKMDPNESIGASPLKNDLQLVVLVVESTVASCENR